MRVIALLLIAAVVLVGCGERVKHRTSTSDDKVTLARSSSSFLYQDLGPLDREYRLFGVTANPFGANNRDDYVQSFGVPLMTTHLLVAAPRDAAVAEFKRAQCEMQSAENGFRVVVIAQNAAAQKALDLLSESSAKRRCGRLSGRVLDFEDWLLDGEPRSAEIMQKVTLQQSGFDFSKPFWVESAREISCD